LKFDKIIIDSSPFLRTMMTAGQIAKALEVEEVVINYRASELLMTGSMDYYFTEDPMNKLEYSKHECDFKAMRDSVEVY
jgi:broad specificity phosphatase PhoE